MKESFIVWLSKKTMNNGAIYSSRTISKYESAVRVISKMMLEKGVIAKDLFRMSTDEYILALNKIMHDEDFIEKDTIGKKMYSNGLKKYLEFLEE